MSEYLQIFLARVNKSSVSQMLKPASACTMGPPHIDPEDEVDAEVVAAALHAENGVAILAQTAL
jgi:hypothetical protein